MIVYLAGPIDNAQDHSNVHNVRNVRQDLHTLLKNHVVFDPSAAWTVASTQKPRPALQEINDYALESCDMVVAFLMPNVLTIGTIMEIQLASTLGKTVLLYAPDIKPSWALEGLRGVIHCTDREVLKDIIDSMEAVIG
jgi:nucleoside 2-deoxyribosyltransferase